MIDEMVVNLGKKQVDDDSKKVYCEKMLDESDDKRKGLEQSIWDSETVISEMEDAIATLIEEIKALMAGVIVLDKSVAEATENCKEENPDYKELIANDGTAKK
eukprot:13578396-Heterocapsa_arctica.AAC.1